MTPSQHFLTALVLTLAWQGFAYANPDVKDGAIKVLVNFKTSCNLQGLTREDTPDNGLRFTVECANKTFYPDDLVVLCPVRDSDVSCEIMTAPIEFKYLNMIYGPMGEKADELDENKGQ